MKYLKLFNEQFEIINYYDIRDIFLSVSDYGLRFHDVNKVNTGSLKKDVVDDSDDLIITQTRPGVSITLKPIREAHKNTQLEFSDEFYDELTSAIEHFESSYNCELAHIYLSKNKFVWFKTVDAMKEYTSTQSKESMSWLSTIIITFVTPNRPEIYKY